jgi:enamine deaminase RidA (YjgF/YER057c/UK114 family)
LCGKIGSAIHEHIQLHDPLNPVERIVKLNVFVNCTADFTAQPEVADGASSLMVALFGDAGRHARAAVGVAALPRGAMVEIDAIVAVRPA